MRQPKIAVVGGSLVGPAASLFLRREGFTDVTVYEANPRPHSQSGGVMGVRVQTLTELQRIGISADKVMALTDSDVTAYDIHFGQARLRGTSTFPGMVTSWDTLHAELAARVDVQRGHTILNVRYGDGRQHLVCSCGDQHDADIVLWADGRKSKGRQLTDPDRPLEYNGYVVWRGLTEPPKPTPSGFNRYYDIEGGRLFSVTEPILQGSSAGKSYWEFSHNLTRDEWARIAGRPPESHAFLLPKQVGDAARKVIADNAAGLPAFLVKLTLCGDVSGIPVNDVDLPAHAITHHGANGWSALLGDAIVPVRLQVGAGLNQGVQQAADLAAVMASGEKVMLDAWDDKEIAQLARWVEQGRSRAHRNNLGWYRPVRPGRTAAPVADQWSDPQWVTA